MDDDQFRSERDPVPPSGTPRRQFGGSFFSIGLAGMFALLAFAVLLLLTLPVAPVVMAAAGLIFVMAAVSIFHYVVWGWWLSGMIRDEVEEEERNKREELRQSGLNDPSQRRERPD